MKSKEFFKLTFNPFTRIAGWQALGLGLAFVLLMGTIGTFSKVAFDGAIDMHLVNNLTALDSFALLGIGLLTLILFMYVSGLIISKNFRFIDVAGTITLAKAPFLVLAIAGFFTEAPNMQQLLSGAMSSSQTISLIAISTLSIPIIIWNITLMYNALKVSIGQSGTKLTIVFIAAIVFSEILSKLLITIYL